MALNRTSVHLHCQWRQYVARFIQTSRKVSRKKYNYDLDTLIEWKKETLIAFGSPRKLTKKNKLRKTQKSLSNEISEQLLILYGISESSLSSKNYIGSDVESNLKCTDIPDDILKSLMPPPNYAPVYGLAKQTHFNYRNKNASFSQKKDPFDTPDVVLDTLAKFNTVGIDHKFDSSYIYGSHLENQESITHGQFTENEICIPKISPVPPVDSCLSGSIPHYQDIKKNSEITSRNVSIFGQKDSEISSAKENINSANIQEAAGISESSSSINVRKKETKGSAGMAFSSTTQAKQQMSKEELIIPKMAPIPSFTTTKSQQSLDFFHSQRPLSPLHQSSFPIEAPDSFEIIPKIPLFPMQNNVWEKSVDSHKLTDFRVDVEQMFLRAFPSVKSILNKTMPDLNRYFLNRWREGMIKELGEEGFKQHQDATIKRGANLHANIMEFLSGKPLSDMQIMSDNEGHWCSIQKTLAAISDIQALEREFVHSALLYRGVCDCIARYKDILCVIDWKTSKKSRPLLKNTYDDPVQVAAYLGAINSNEAYVAKYGQVNYGMIVVAYPDGSPAHIHMMNKALCEQYWQDWTERLHTFYQLTYTERISVKKIGAVNAS